MRRLAIFSAPILLLLSCSSEPSDNAPPDAQADAAVAEDAHEIAPDATPADTGIVPEMDAGLPDAGDDMCTSGPRKPAPPSRLQIINGTRQPQEVQLSPEQIMSVVGIASETGGAWCSGTLIADRIVLTAVHCTITETSTSMRVIFGEDDLQPDLSIRVIDKLEHPYRDTTLLTLEFAPSTLLAIRPIPIFAGTMSAGDEGMMLEEGGYGDTQAMTHGRFFARETLFAVNAATFTVDGHGQMGVCYGDSGGPSLMTTPEGDVRVLGDLSQGDEMCAHQDDYVRVDLLRPWIETVTGPTPGAGMEPCGPITEEGQCSNFGTTVSYCDNHLLVREDCAMNDVCGWSGTGWRCVTRATDPCEELSHYGTCDGETARWCDHGTIKTRACDQCMETCLYLGERIGFDCGTDPNDCGELDYLGWCKGDVSEWCEDGMRQKEDCTAMNKVCRFVDTETGYYCADP